MMAPAAEPLLDVRDLVTAFRTEDGTVKAVDEVSFRVEAGKTLGIVGESGCGKSVTALSIMRLIPESNGEIAGGSIRLEGENLLIVARGLIDAVEAAKRQLAEPEVDGDCALLVIGLVPSVDLPQQDFLD